MDFHTIARMAAGTSGAELANIINEAALRAVRNGRTVVEQADLEESIEVVIAGYQKKNAIMTDGEKKVVAYHEIGHALVAALQSASAPVQKITIIIPLSVLNSALVTELATLTKEHPGNTELYFKVTDDADVSHMSIDLISRPIKLSVGRDLITYLKERPELGFHIN